MVKANGRQSLVAAGSSYGGARGFSHAPRASGFRASKHQFRKTMSDFFKDQEKESSSIISVSSNSVNSQDKTESRGSKENGIIISPRTAKFLEENPPDHKNPGFKAIPVSAEFLKNNSSFDGEDGYVVSPRTFRYLQDNPPEDHKVMADPDRVVSPRTLKYLRDHPPSANKVFTDPEYVVSPRTLKYLKEHPPGSKSGHVLMSPRTIRNLKNQKKHQVRKTPL